jgi:hypothetical protein
MTLASYIPGDPRLSISESVAHGCLDNIRGTLKNENLPDDSYLIIMTAISLWRERKDHGILDFECIDKFNGGKEERQILNYKRLSDDHLAFLYSEAIKEVGIDKAMDFKEVSKLWSSWAEEGLKILYCNYFMYYARKDIGYLLDKIFKMPTIDVRSE